MGTHGQSVAPQETRPPRRWATATGEPCPRTVRLDGTIEGSGDCMGCGLCLLFGDLVLH
jgi:hypothetical protein